MKSPLAALAILLLLQVPAHSQGVVINEIHYDPVDKTRGEEFVELTSTAGGDTDLSGWFFSSGIRFTFPEGTKLSSGGYLVIAEDPADFQRKFGFAPDLGPCEGRLSNGGERLVLRRADGELADEVDYQVGFPWPIASGGQGSSMELISPDIDNDLGGSWRASGYSLAPPAPPEYYLRAGAEGWHYRKGISEASNPTGAWRLGDFVEDGTWLVGRAGIGYGDGDDSTELTDMRGSYSSVYLRHSFTVADPAEIPDTIRLRVYVDDGCVVWINGIEVARLYVTAGEKAYNDFGVNHEASWEEVELPDPASLFVAGENMLAIHALNQSLTSSDFSVDASLLIPGSSELEFGDPTPGQPNSVASDTVPPRIRQVAHAPQQPVSGAPFFVTAKVTDPAGVAGVTILYQVVAPGDFIPAFLPRPHNVLLADPTRPKEPNPEFEDASSWTEAAMVDDGSSGDELAGDGVFTAFLPPQENRTLVRYRIRATNLLGVSVQVPYVDDASLNFACFVYDGVPPYTVKSRTVQPGGTPYVYSREVMTSIPVYFLLTRHAEMVECIAYDSALQIPKSNEGARDAFNWEGAFVYEGIVYDHVRYRLRQANDRYGRHGKRAMRIRFNKGSHLRARDRDGKRYPTRWRTLNIGKGVDNKGVGNFGLTETLNAILWNMVGVPSPHFHPFHFRVVDGQQEAPAAADGQYRGDFWGLYAAVEDYDSRFLDSHQLEDGNLYKLKDQVFDGNKVKRHQGRNAVADDSDFQNIHHSLRPERSDSWLNTYVNYDRWYPYHTIVEAVRHYDFRPADSHLKNRAWYFEPAEGNPYGRLWTLPHDSDASWGPNWNSGEDYSKYAIYGGSGKPAFKQKYRNVIREIRDLLWTSEVIPEMIDDLAARVAAFSKADRDRWRNAPADEGYQDFGSIEAKVQDMKNFAFVGWSGSTGPTVPAGGRANYLDSLARAEGDASAIPRTPVVTSDGAPGFPLDDLKFRSSAFSDPQGNSTFAAMKWRVGEVTDPSAPGYDPLAPNVYEWTAAWESAELTEFQATITIPPVLNVGQTYRVRVRMMDTTGRWSHWSAPVEFTVGAPSSTIPQQEYLRVTEVMYHPLRGSDLEFIELSNTGPAPLDLDLVAFTEGIRFRFADGDVPQLGPGEYLVLVQNKDVFSAFYDTRGMNIAGEYEGRLANSNEPIVLTYGGNTTIQNFTYQDGWLPMTDGGGYSLTAVDPEGPLEAWSSPDGWRESKDVGGSPGTADDGSVPTGGWQLPSDGNQDGIVDISDGVVLLLQLFGGASEPPPCEGGAITEGGNITLFDANADAAVDLSDVIFLLGYLFQSGPPPVLGTRCLRIDGCPSACAF